MSDKNIDDLFSVDMNPEKPKKAKAAAKKPAKAKAKAVAAPVPAIAEHAPVATPNLTEAAAPKAARNRTKTIIIDEQEGENNYVFVGYNGKHWQIQRGVEVEVPEPILEILNHAVASRLVLVVDPQSGQRRYESRNYLRFPYRVVRG